MTSSSAIRDVIRVAARCDQADDLSEGLESARSTARSPEGIETRLHAVCHYGSCDACDGPGVELRGRPRVGLGVALSLVCGPWTPTRGKPERRRGPPCFGAEPERGAEPLALSRRLVLSFVGRGAAAAVWSRGARARIVRCYRFRGYGSPVTGYTFLGTVRRSRCTAWSSVWTRLDSADPPPVRAGRDPRFIARPWPVLNALSADFGHACRPNFAILPRGCCQGGAAPCLASPTSREHYVVDEARAAEAHRDRREHAGGVFAARAAAQHPLELLAILHAR